MRFFLAVTVCFGCLGNTFAKDNKEEIERIVREMNSKRYKTNDEFLAKLADCGEGAAKPICDEIASQGIASWGGRIFSHLEKAMPDLGKPLSKVVLDKDYKVRIDSAKALIALEKKAVPANKILIEVIREEVLKLARPLVPDDRLAAEQLTRACMDVLAKTGHNDDNVFAFFKKLATNPEIKHANNIFALQTLVEWAKGSNDKLKEIYPLVLVGVRNNANAPDYIALLPAFGDRARTATSTLRPLTTSDNPVVRASAEKALAYLERK